MASSTPLLLQDFELTSYGDSADDDEEINTCIDDNGQLTELTDRRNKKRMCIACVLLIVLFSLIIIVVSLVQIGGGHPSLVAKSAQPLCEQWKSDSLSVKCSRFECPPVILISFDGFRYDYFNRNVTPTFKRVMENGVSASYMRPSFPSRTFPNHYTIVTGLYPESHGIVDNSIYDPIMNKTGSIGPEFLNSYWWSGEPVWNTVQKFNKMSGTAFWPGSEVDINGVRPTYWLPYNETTTFEERVQQVLDWIKMDNDKRPDLITLYISEPDAAGHSFGPSSEQVTAAVRNVDAQLNSLLDGLRKQNILDCVNIIIVSDHGMADCNQTAYFDVSSRIKNLDDYLFFNYVNSRLRSKTGEAPDETIRKLGCHDHFQMYKKEDIPVRLHYAANQRIDPIVLLPDEGWFTSADSQSPINQNGSHGWDNLDENMQAIFMAIGPYFKQNYTTTPFQNIEIYNLICTLLNVTSAPNNGTMGSLDHLLRYAVDRHQWKEYRLVACAAEDSVPENACRRRDQSAFTERTVSLDTDTCFVDWSGNYRSLFDTKRRLVKTIMTRDPVQWFEINPNDVNAMCAEGQVSSEQQLSQRDWANLTSNQDVTAVLMHWTGDRSSTNPPSTLLVPMYKAFIPYWTALIKMANQDFSQGSDLVVMGPVFDYNSDGRADPVSNQVIPSHYFVSVIRGERASRFDITSWVVPHRSMYTSCRSERTWLSKHGTSLRDIELLTTMTFYFNELPNTELRLHLSLPSA